MYNSMRRGGDRGEGGRWRGLLDCLHRPTLGRWIMRIVEISILIAKLFVFIVKFFCNDG